VRWANDLVTRFKMLHKGGHTDIELFDLPEPMTKPDATQWLKDQPAYDRLKPEAQYAVVAKLEEYSKGSKGEVKISLDEIKSRPTIEGWDTVNTGHEDTLTSVDQYIKEHQ